MTEKGTHKPTTEGTKLPDCGIIMPISAIDGCSEQHWAEVKDILFDVIGNAGFEANLVSNADEIGVIQKRIVQNLYENPVVICDVSGRNPNVMFELGMRLAFDKPTIIIKDEVTPYSFDTGNIEHIQYPRDLRYNSIVSFKKHLSDKVQATYLEASKNAAYSTFLKHFGEFTVAKLDTKEVSRDEYFADELAQLRQQINKLTSLVSPPARYVPFSDHRMPGLSAAISDMPASALKALADDIAAKATISHSADINHAPASPASVRNEVIKYLKSHPHASDDHIRLQLASTLSGVIPDVAVDAMLGEPEIRALRNL